MIFSPLVQLQLDGLPSVRGEPTVQWCWIEMHREQRDGAVRDLMRLLVVAHAGECRYLDGLGLTGSIPSAVGQLTALTSL